MSPLSGYQMWKAGQAKARHKVKNWAARILTKQARKVQNHLIERWRIYRGDQVMVVAGKDKGQVGTVSKVCLLYTSPSPRDQRGSRMPSSA